MILSSYPKTIKLLDIQGVFLWLFKIRQKGSYKLPFKGQNGIYLSRHCICSYTDE